MSQSSTPLPPGAAPQAPEAGTPAPTPSHSLRADLNQLEGKIESFFASHEPEAEAAPVLAPVLVSAPAAAPVLQPEADLYQYNYTKLAPLALIDTLPKAEKPRLNWYLQIALISLQAARNRMAWHPAAARAPGDEPLMFSGDGAVSAGTLDLHHLGLGGVDLHALHVDAVGPEHLECVDAAQLEHAPEEGGPLSFGPGGNIPLKLLKTLMGVAREAVKQGIDHPLGILKLVLKTSDGSPAGRPQSLADYRGLFHTFKLPWIADCFESDETFAWMRVAGFNPMVLQRVTALDPKFPVTEDQFRLGMGDLKDSLAQAGAEGRLFVCDYAALARVKNGNFPSGPKYCFAPLALFALPKGTGPRRLQAIAIQCGQDPRLHRVFTPADDDAWRKAKLAVMVADFNHHEMVSHLARTHLLIGPMPIATHRCLPEQHPVRALLLPHFEGLLYINDSAQSTLVAPGQEVDKSLAGTIWASRQLAAEGLLAKGFNELFLPVELEARGVADPQLDYPYRDDAREVWRAIERWVTGYVGLYYASDAAVRADAALQQWAAELVSRDGGRLQGFGDAGDGRIQTVAYLCRALTMIVFTSSAQHAAVNFPQGELMTYAPATPPAAYRAAPLSREDSELNDYLDYLPPLEVAQLQMDFLHLLGGVYFTRLGEYETGHFRDERVRPLLARFQKDLQGVEALIAERNRRRYGPYPFLLPSRIPQSTNI